VLEQQQNKQLVTSSVNGTPNLHQLFDLLNSIVQMITSNVCAPAIDNETTITPAPQQCGNSSISTIQILSTPQSSSNCPVPTTTASSVLKHLADSLQQTSYTLPQMIWQISSAARALSSSRSSSSPSPTLTHHPAINNNTHLTSVYPFYHNQFQSISSNQHQNKYDYQYHTPIAHSTISLQSQQQKCDTTTPSFPLPPVTLPISIPPPTLLPPNKTSPSSTMFSYLPSTPTISRFQDSMSLIDQCRFYPINSQPRPIPPSPVPPPFLSR